MEEIQPKTGKIGFTYGLLLAGIGIIFGLMLYMADLHYERGWAINLVNFLIMAAVIVMAISYFKKTNGGNITLGEAMKVGLATAVIAGIVSLIWQMIFINVIEPEFLNNVFEKSRVEMIQENPKMTAEQIKQGEGMIKTFTSPGVIAIMTLVSFLFFGSLISLISGLIMKKQKPAY